MYNRHQKTILRVFVFAFLMTFVRGNVIANTLQYKTAERYYVLSKDKSISEQLNQKNTAYEIRYDFDLKKGNLTIPEGCVLIFSGGRLMNGTVNLNACYIEGNAIFDCGIIGCPSNEDIYTKWFIKADTQLFVLLRNFCSCWYDEKLQIITHKKKRVIHVEKSTYTVTEGIDLRYEEDLTIDFAGSTIIDDIDTYDKLRHRCSSVIAMRESSRVSFANCIYKTGKHKGEINEGGSFIFIGGPHVTTMLPSYDIKVVNVTGETNSEKSSKFIPFCVLGNCYNIEIGNINWEGNVSSLVNVESAMGPITSTDVKSKFGVKTWPYPDFYGQMPYNIKIHDINGYRRPVATKGYIRTGGAYNVSIQNVYCKDVMEIVELFQGDAGNLRSAMNITVNNVTSYWSEEIQHPNYAVSIDFSRKNPQQKEPNLENTDIAMIKFINCDFQDNGKGDVDKHYLIRVFGNEGMTVFENCRFKNTKRAIRISDKINTSLFRYFTRFESCLFQDCVVGVDCQNSIVTVQDCIFDANKTQVNQIRYSILGLSAETLSNAGAMLNAEGNMFRSQGIITSPYVSISSTTSLPKNVRLNVSRNIFNNTKNVAAIKVKNIVLDEEKNIGAKVIDK